MSDGRYHTAVIGAGIVGLATALALLDKRKGSVLVVEAEVDVAVHQTGHNSGVIHSGLYYRPGSLKARNCAEGREAMYRFCEEHDIAHDRCGKLVVATRPEELPALDVLYERGLANGLVGTRRLRAEEIAEIEPHTRGVAALFVPQTGIVDYRAVAAKMAALIEAGGGTVRRSARVHAVRPGDALVLETNAGDFACEQLVNCAGLYSDRVARMCGLDPGLRIVPFRGEYYELLPSRTSLVRHLIYPVPDARFPFLGVHFTRMIGGGVEAGPNAVLALKREGYQRTSFSAGDVAELLAFPGFWRMGWRHWRTGLAEQWRSLSKAAFARALQALVPDVCVGDLTPAGSGVRAQAVERSGALVDDFRFVRAARMVHVLNAPSPAATSSLSIGKEVASQLD